MSYPHSPPADLDEHVPVARDPRNSDTGDAREVLTSALLGIGLMAIATVWWWFAMR
jgi:hypothetical protein